MINRAVVLFALLATMPSCSNVVCGEGTFRSGNDCVGYDPNDKAAPIVTVTPPGGRTRDPLPNVIMMMTDEPAMIYYTIDGTDPDPSAGTGEPAPITIVGVTQGMTLKYVAVDRASNRTSVTSTTFVSDIAAPAPVDGFTVTLNGSAPHVTWTPPTDPDYAGTVLARVADVVDVVPTAGQMVANGTALSPSLQVVSVGTATSFDDSARPPGPVRYVAWTFDDLGNYSHGVSARTDLPIGTLTAQLTFNSGNATPLAIPTSPANLDLSASTATLNGTTLTVTLSVKNNTNQFFQNPKVEIVGTANGTFTGSDGTADARPFRTLGPNMLAPGATKAVDLVYTGVAANTTVTMDLEIAQHPSLATLSNAPTQTLVDLGSGLSQPGLLTTARGPNDRPNGRVRPGVLTGGRYMDVPTTHGTIERFDLVTRMKAGTINLGIGERANVQWVMSTGGELLAMIKYAGKRNSGTIELVRLDEGLHELARKKLDYSDNTGFARPAVSPDGRVLAIPVTAGILLLDVTTLSPIDAVPSSPLVDLLTTGFTDRTHSVTFFNGTDGLIAIAANGGQAAIIKRTATSFTTRLHQEASTAARGFATTMGPDGRVWLAFSTGLRVYDPTADTVTPVTYAQTPQGVATAGGKLYVMRSDRITLDEISTAGAIVRTLTPALGARGHWVGFMQ